MKLRFKDGVEFDTFGKLRIERRFDGLYVVGEGILMPVNSYEEGREVINEFKNGTQAN